MWNGVSLDWNTNLSEANGSFHSWSLLKLLGLYWAPKIVYRCDTRVQWSLVQAPLTISVQSYKLDLESGELLSSGAKNVHTGTCHLKATVV